MTFAQCIKPSQRGGLVQIFLVIKREKSVVDTNPTKDLYVVTAWITYKKKMSQLFSCHCHRTSGRHTVRRKSTGRTGSSMICCITTARTSERKTSVIEKQILIALYPSASEHIHANCLIHTFDCTLAFEPIFFFSIVQKNHKFHRCK